LTKGGIEKEKQLIFSCSSLLRNSSVPKKYLSKNNYSKE
jgi:hypothetical protein